MKDPAERLTGREKERTRGKEEEESKEAELPEEYEDHRTREESLKIDRGDIQRPADADYRSVRFRIIHIQRISASSPLPLSLDEKIAGFAKCSPTGLRSPARERRSAFAILLKICNRF